MKRKTKMTEQETTALIEKAEKISLALKEIMTKTGKSVSTAESCTGGLVARIITEVPGSSEYFKGGVVSYTNEIKMKFLNVRQSTLDRFTEVSAQTAAEMADGIRRGMDTSFGLSVTGVAGPGGATGENPVGSVYMAIASDSEETKVYHKIFPGNRAAVRAGAACFIISALFDILKARQP